MAPQGPGRQQAAKPAAGAGAWDDASGRCGARSACKRAEDCGSSASAGFHSQWRRCNVNWSGGNGASVSADVLPFSCQSKCMEQADAQLAASSPGPSCSGSTFSAACTRAIHWRGVPCPLLHGQCRPPWYAGQEALDDGRC
mmetsp:Transcript_79273/g.256650  ORF Transcript_79273/g.256650 Transcript_79273/m.256650 type:complete len:141 (-) Transcript_79273:523-945(-)